MRGRALRPSCIHEAPSVVQACVPVPCSECLNYDPLVARFFLVPNQLLCVVGAHSEFIQTAPLARVRRVLALSSFGTLVAACQ
jgi:hypothetical protein